MSGGTRKKASFILVFFLSLGLGRLLAHLGWLEFWEMWNYDLFHQLSGVRREVRHVAIVSVDNDSLLKLEGEPMIFWGPRFARAIETLRKIGVRVIGLDYLFSLSPEAWITKFLGESDPRGRLFDAPLRKELSSGCVVLIGVLAGRNDEGGELLLPVEDYLYSLPNGIGDIGWANFLADKDGVIRRFLPVLGQGERGPLVSFGVLLALKAMGMEEGSEISLGIARPTAIPIGFAGPPGTVKRVSMAKLLDSEAESDPEIRSLAGKVVIIASEHIGLQDLHLTPYARSILGVPGRLMSGAEIHASVTETILSGLYPKPVPRGLSWLVGAFVMGMAIWIFLKLDPWKGMALVVAVSSALTLGSFVVFLTGWVFPLSDLHASILVSFLSCLGLRLNREERERSRLKALFSRYVAKDVVELIVSGKRKPDLGGEAVEVTILFCDIRDFTRISELLGPTEVVELLNAFFSKASQAVLKQGGMIDKYLGDGMMALFGWPVQYPDHAVRAVMAAKEIVKVAGDLTAWVQERYGSKGMVRLSVGVGLNTGIAVLGNIGSPARMEFTAIGDAVNLASRCEGLSRELGWAIVASWDTAVRAGVEPKEIREMLVKGKKDPVVVCRIDHLVEGGEKP